MKNRINQNSGNEQPMNQAQTNGQAYLANPYSNTTMPTNPQNMGQQSFDTYQLNKQAYYTPPYNQPKKNGSMHQQHSSYGYQPNENDEPGKITNRDRAMQILDFSNLRYGKCTPMNIDMVLDVKKYGYIFGEIKYFPSEATEQIQNGDTNPEDKIILGEQITLN